MTTMKTESKTGFYNANDVILQDKHIPPQTTLILDFSEATLKSQRWEGENK